MGHCVLTELVAAVGAGLFPEAGGVTSVAGGEFLLLDTLALVVRAECLLGGSDEVFVLALAGDLVELLVSQKSVRTDP